MNYWLKRFFGFFKDRKNLPIAFAVFFLAIAVFVFFGGNNYTHPKEKQSVEIAFTEKSPRGDTGGVIIPASCGVCTTEYCQFPLWSVDLCPEWSSSCVRDLDSGLCLSGYVTRQVNCTNYEHTPGECTPPPPPPPPLPGNFNLNLGGPVTCNSVPLSWGSSSNAAAYRILKGDPRVDISPYQPYVALNFSDTAVSQNTTYKYQIEAYNITGTNRSNTLNVTTPYCPPILNFSGNPISIYQGQSTTLTWSTSFVTSCTASGAWSGFKAVNGNEFVVPLPPPTVTYGMQCSGPGGTTPVQSVTINVAPLALPSWKEIIPR